MLAPTVLQGGLDRKLGVVGELVAVAAEELDAVVLVGVVRGRQHDGEVERVAVQQQRRGRRRQHAAEQRVAARGRDARGHRRLQHLAGLARVAQEEHTRALGGQLRGRGARQPERQLRAHLLARDSSDAIRPEQLAGHRSAPS